MDGTGLRQIWVAGEVNAQMRFTVAEIIRATAERFEIAPDEIVEPHIAGKSRKRRVARPRQVAMFLARDLVSTPRKTERMGRQPVSYPVLGRIFSRDHSTVIHAVRAIPKLAANDSDLDEKIKQIRQMLGAL